MKMKMIVLLMCGILSLLAAESITVDAISGKVQIQQGSSWVDISAGAELDPGTVISTGFRSTARLNTGSAIIEVAQLTRLTIEELISKEDSVTTTLFLNGGRINAEVSRENLRQDFTVRSSVATASVRGTGFTFDGRRLQVSHGAVLMQSRGRSVMAFRGDVFHTGNNGRPPSRVQALREENRVKAVLEVEDEEDLEEILSEMGDDLPPDFEVFEPDMEELTADLDLLLN